jgi:hypothetical protein
MPRGWRPGGRSRDTGRRSRSGRESAAGLHAFGSGERALEPRPRHVAANGGARSGQAGGHQRGMGRRVRLAFFPVVFSETGRGGPRQTGVRERGMFVVSFCGRPRQPGSSVGTTRRPRGAGVPVVEPCFDHGRGIHGAEDAMANHDRAGLHGPDRVPPGPWLWKTALKTGAHHASTDARQGNRLAGHHSREHQ